MSISAIGLLIALVALVGAAQSQEIADLYSNIDSADITIDGDAASHVLRMELISDGKVLQTKNMMLDGPGTWIVMWSPLETKKGNYNACATLLDGGTEVCKKCYSFFYGGVEPIRFDVRDFRADSRGMHLSISSSDPTMVDIYYMLFTGNKSVYITREQGVPIAGGFSTPVQKDYAWRQILENNKHYTGRVKIVELNHNQVRTFMNSFLANDDAAITETYQDETGASATVVGNSRVPFEGKLRFILSQNGTVLSTTEEKTPVLLTGDDETVEISWNKTLEPGIYQLQTILLGQGGDIKDMEENIIEAKSIVRASNITDTQKTSPHPAGAAAAALIAIALIRRRRLRDSAISGDGINAKNRYQ
ncbi:MAG: hypothetical protein GYA29_02335 [Methanothrix sp.]|jgi:MYXO-CTERM domain-containing protein|nr:hypothetical protein [Methanothrix sp.]